MLPHQNQTPFGKDNSGNLKTIGVIEHGNVLGRRAVIHLWLKHTPSRTILSELMEVYGKDVISVRAVEKRTAAFDGCGNEFIDLYKLGRTRDPGKIEVIHALIEGKGCLFQKTIAEMLGIHHETVKRILRDSLNMRKVNFKGCRTR